VSRKKAKGKARKAVKADSSAAAAQECGQEGALEAQLQMQRLIIDSLPSPRPASTDSTHFQRETFAIVF